MKIDFSTVDATQFMMHQHIVNGEACTLIQPQFIGATWTAENKIFRSSLWNYHGELISAGFPKFTNWGEKPDVFPLPSSLKNTNIIEKLDGSLLIVSKYKGHYILRTRGTSDASKLDNGHELELFRANVLPLLESDMYSNFMVDTWGHSVLFEWTSPIQKIVLNYGDTPVWTLVGVIKHEDYSLWTQKELDVFATKQGLNRPVHYIFPEVDDLIKGIEAWKGKEGVCVYSKNDQVIHKVKSAWYLALHRMKESLSSIDKVIDVWHDQGEPSYQTFEKFITDQFDYELFQQIRGEVSNICDASKEVKKILDGFNVFVNDTLRPLPSRKEQALKVVAAYGITNRASFIFKLLDGKELGSEDRKKLLYQVLKK
jgi:hypothetical protein